MNEFDHEMETSGAELGSVPKPKLAFIDDEQRILRSMKLLFRKTHDVFITTDPTEYIDYLCTRQKCSKSQRSWTRRQITY